MDQPEIKVLEQQILELKRGARRLWVMLLTVAIALPAVVLFVRFQSTAPDQVVRTTQFVLIDKNQRVQAKLSSNDMGFPSLALYDSKGATRVEVGITELHTGFFVYDPDGRTVTASLIATPVNYSQLHLSQPGGKSLDLIAINDAAKGDASAKITMGEVEGPDEIVVENNRKFSVLFFNSEPTERDPTGITSLMLASDRQPQSSEITMNDRAGKNVLALKAPGTGKALINVWDNERRTMVDIAGSKK